MNLQACNQPMLTGVSGRSSGSIGSSFFSQVRPPILHIFCPQTGPRVSTSVFQPTRPEARVSARSFSASPALVSTSISSTSLGFFASPARASPSCRPQALPRASTSLFHKPGPEFPQDFLHISPVVVDIESETQFFMSGNSSLFTRKSRSVCVATPGLPGSPNA